MFVKSKVQVAPTAAGSERLRTGEHFLKLPYLHEDCLMFIIYIPSYTLHSVFYFNVFL